VHTFVKLLSIILITSYHAFANAAVEITYDTEDVINSFERNPVGINLNSLTDKDITTEALSSIKVKSLRFPMGEMSDWMIFDKNNPDVMGVSIQDPNNIFTSDSFTENNNSIWKYNLGFNKFIEHCQTLKAEPYVVIGIDALKYTGSYPKATKQDIIQAAKDWVEYANITQKYNC